MNDVFAFLVGLGVGTLYGSFGVWWLYIRPSRKEGGEQRGD